MKKIIVWGLLACPLVQTQALTLVGVNSQGEEEVTQLPSNLAIKKLAPITLGLRDKAVTEIERQSIARTGFELNKFSLGLQVKGKIGLGPIVSLSGDAAIELIFSKILKDSGGMQ